MLLWVKKCLLIFTQEKYNSLLIMEKPILFCISPINKILFFFQNRAFKSLSLILDLVMLDMTLFITLSIE